jgi:hypothetical protein
MGVIVAERLATMMVTSSPNLHELILALRARAALRIVCIVFRVVCRHVLSTGNILVRIRLTSSKNRFGSRYVRPACIHLRRSSRTLDRRGHSSSPGEVGCQRLYDRSRRDNRGRSHRSGSSSGRHGGNLSLSCNRLRRHSRSGNLSCCCRSFTFIRVNRA